MMPVVPFVSQASGAERLAWRSALPEALKDIADVKPFQDLTPEERAAARVAIVANPDPAEVAELSNLVWVQSLWAGVERLTAELPQDGPLIVRLMDPQMGETMSEAVLAWTLYLHRDMPRYALQQRQRIWLEHELKLPSERTVGILGMGHLGSAAAKRLSVNGFQVLGWSRNTKDVKNVETFCGEEGLTEILCRSDILVLLMPLTADTRGLLNEATFASAKPGMALINFARGPIVETDALLSALDRDQVSHAVLDVFDEEPLPADHPFWEHEKVTVLPHISAPTITSTAARIVASNIGRYFATGEIPAGVDRKRGY